MALGTDSSLAATAGRAPGAVAVLVDEHLLDSYLALAALRPAEAYLLHVGRMASQARRLADRALERLGVRAVAVPVADDTDVEAVEGAIDRLPAGAHFHVTGGTGAMGALSARRWDGPTSCLDEDRRLLRFGDGADVELTELVDPADVTLDDVLALSAFERWGRGAVHGRGPTTAEALCFLEEPGRAPQAGTWLETAVAAIVRDAQPGYAVETQLVLRRDGAGQIELDVVAMGHYRPYVLSCTTSGGRESLRKRLFEVEVRAGQLGGPVARPALVCLTDALRRALDDLVADPWPSASAARVFRREDLAQPAAAFRAWLES